MDILKEAIDLTRGSDHISYAFADINCSLCVKLMVCSSFSTLLMISVTCRILYLFFVFALICELVLFFFILFFSHFSLLLSSVTF